MTTPRPGHWGGIVYRNDLDNAEERFNYEREGIFLNYVNHADIRYGGGNVVVDSVRQIVTPVQMLQARPTIASNVITLSADAPLSADPDSFEETNFHAPRYQLKGLFTSDYDRVGPEIHGNLLRENSTNGLFLKINTPAGDAQNQLTVSGRFDDTDVVHVLSENLVIAGKSGEPILELDRPPMTVVTLATRSGGQMEPGTYNYKIVFVDANGFEGRPSEATSAITVSAASPNRSVRLDKLPAASGDFVARRIYRSVSGVAGPYVFVAQINTSDAAYIDTKSLASLDPTNVLQRDVPTVQGVGVVASTAAGTLAAGQYNYRITYVNSTTGEESPSSDPTVTRTLNAVGQITLSGITRPRTNGYDLIRVYRSSIDAEAPYTLAGEISATLTSFVDLGETPPIDLVLAPESFGVSRARTNARLTIDPGLIIKLEGSRIETSFGAQLIAEGQTGKEIIFTSRSDDRYGAGGTFDTSGDGSARTPAPGDWGGLYIGPAGSASIDSALLTFGGGVTKIEGTFKAFNILEVHQSDLRLVNSVIEFNADGQAGQGPADRFGRGVNEPATIYVRGAQPILVNNVVQNNDEIVLTINANSFTPDSMPDTGRSRGAIGLTGNFTSNTGPLIRLNRMVNNPLNGMDIRGEVLTTQSIWDDTDIVHVLRGEQIVVPDFHSEVGLRLQSSASASLVVKMAGEADNFDPYIGAGFTATGRQLEIDDRIGGTLQIVGQPDFPVILTSLSDDSVGAGFQPNGETLKDTNNNGWTTLPSAGDWRSVRLEQYANDRNVELVLETEIPTSTAPGENATPSSAQNLGDLAASEYAGDENLRLGFDIRGLLNARNDIDVYSFGATAGTEVWLDIDRTTNTLNSVVELIDALGTVVARSDDSLNESLDPSLLYRADTIAADTVNPLQKTASAYTPTNASGLAKDFYSLNKFDAGMRVVLPGVAGTRSTYHVRVRSSSENLDDLSGGLTTGSYQMQIRLRETDEVSGVTVRYADVRYATNGIEVFGLPGHSPLLGEVAEDEEVGGPENNGQIPSAYEPHGGPQDIGNLFQTDRAALSIAGTIHSLDDIDLYEMQLAYAATAGSEFQNASVVFDVDYASGLSRPDTIVSVFDSFGRLVLIGRNSNVTDDRSAALDDGNLSDLARGSLGALDPYIGPVSLPEATYFVSVTSNARVPTQLLSNPALRLEPVNTVTRVAEDHIGSSGGSTAGDPQVPLLLDQSSIVPEDSSSLVLFILHDTGNPDEVQLSAANLTSGVVTRTVGPYPGKVQDLATDADGNTFTLTTPDEDPAPSDSTVGVLRGVNTSAPQFIASRDDGILTYRESATTPGVAVLANVGIRFHAMAYGEIGGVERLFAVGSRGDAGTPPAGPTDFTNILYQFDAQTGEAISAPQADRVGNARMQGAGTQIVERGVLNTFVGDGPGGQVTGLAIQNGQLYAMSENGGIYLVQDPLSTAATLQYIGDIIPDSGRIDEVEINNSRTTAQDLDRELWTQRFDPNIGDATTNTSQTIKHLSIRGTGDDAFAGFFIQGEAGGLDVPTGSAFNPVDGNFYVASAGTNEVLRYDGTTGQFIDVFVTASSGGLNGPADIAFGPDGHLYVASTQSDSILRYDRATGAFINAFVRTGAGGLDGPTGMLFGPDGNLYVSSSNTHEVLRFRGTTGAFMNVLVRAGDGGLVNPSGLTFDSTGTQLYVVSVGGQSVLRYDGVTGIFQEVFVPGGSGGLSAPNLGIKFGIDNHLYVSSGGSNAVLRYHSQSGAFIDAYVPSNADSLQAPSNLLFDAAGTLFVNSRGNDRVLQYIRGTETATWQWQAELPNGAVLSLADQAGSGVAIDGDTLVVGVPRDDDAGSDAGAVYVYLRQVNGTPSDQRDDTWLLQAKLSASDAAAGDAFGISVALDGNLLVVGASQTDQSPTAANAGSAYVFRRSGTIWTQEGKLQASDPLADRLLGIELAVSADPSGDTVVLGAPREVIASSFVTNATPAAGTFAGDPRLSDIDDFYNGSYVRFESGPLAGQARLVTDYAGATRTFTFGTAFTAPPVTNDTFEVLHNDAGSAYIFRFDGTTWAQQQKLVASDTAAFDMFGRAVAVEQGTILVGAPNANNNAGAAYQFVRDDKGTPNPTDDTWSQSLQWGARDAATGDKFGWAIALDGTRSVISALREDDGATNAGSAYVFLWQTNVWTEVGKLTAPDAAASDRFGESLDVEGDRIVVGATDGDTGVANSGSAYLFEVDNQGTADPFDDVWSVVTELSASHAGADNEFGTSLAISGDTIIVGDPLHDYRGTDSGTAAVFVLGDLAPAVFDTFFVPFGTGGLSDPRQMIIGPDGYLYVASATSSRVLRFDANTGDFVDVFVSTASGGLDRPEGIAFGPDSTGDAIPEVFVSSRGTDQVLRYDGATGDFIDVFAELGIVAPTGLTFGVDRTGDGVPELYVAGFESDNVVEFDGVTGGFVRQLVPPGRGNLNGPVGLSFEADGRLYVVSSVNNRIVRYNAATGDFVSTFVAAGSGGLSQPQYFAFGPDTNGDGDRELYVSSYANDSVLRYNGRTGAFMDDFVYAGNEGLNGPTGLVFIPNGELIVASSLTDAVMEFNTAGTPTFDYFKFTVANANDRGIFDIDFGLVDGDPGSFNAELFILDAAGNVIASNDNADEAWGAGGSTDPADPFIDVVFPAAGVYYAMVGEFNSNVLGGAGTGNRADLTDTYRLHVSIEDLTNGGLGNTAGSSMEGLASSMLPSAEMAGVFVAINRSGDLFAFTTDGTNIVPAEIFDGAQSRIPTGIQDVMGLTLSNTNMWHISDARMDDDGHGLTNVFDDSRGNASVVTEREENDTPATAHDLELEFWGLGYDSNIGDTQDPPVNTSTTIPHVTIKGSGNGTFDFYSFEVTTAGARGIFDVDMDYDEQLDPHGFMDSEIVLLDQYGNIITWLEDSALPTDGDGGKSLLFDPPLEPCLEYVFPAAGTYVLAVTKNVDGLIFQPPEEGDFYTLQVSIENHRIDGPKTEAGNSFFFGPELTGDVLDAVAGDPVTITSPGHGLLGGERVDVQGILGIPGANGTFAVNVVDDDTFELVGTDATGTYLGGGTWRLLQIPEDVQGSIVTRPFSLLGYSPEDLPTLYFNYLLDAEAAADVDLAGVSIIVGNGAPQPLVVKGAGLVNSTPGAAVPQWLQARVDLSAFANRENLRLQFDFQSNDSSVSTFEGLLIDDIIIGFAERGEMVSHAYNDPSFIINPDSQTTDALTGPYQLEIRPATDAGMSRAPEAGAPNSEALQQTFDTNERHAQQTSLVPPAGSELQDGQTFTISDGVAALTFEFDNDDVVQDGHVKVAFESIDTAQQIGHSIRDAINSPAVQSALDITATVSAATIRGVNFADGTVPTDALYQLVDLAGNAIVNGIRQIQQYGDADLNRFRDQGQVIIHSNFVTDSRDFGIVADAGTRDVETRLATAMLEPHMGAARNLRVLNNQPAGGLAPGVVIENNVINNEGLGGIHVSGNIAPFELTPPSDTDLYLSGEVVRDGTTFTIHGYRTSVTFEFEDISGGALPMGSNVQGGNGWREGNIPVFYRQSGSSYLAPPWVIPPRPYVQAEMAIAIRDAIQSSILVTNATTLHANASLEASRWLRSALVPVGALWGPPLVSVYVDNVSSVDIPSSTNLDTRRDAQNLEVPVPIGAAAQAYHRVINNTVVGNDGRQAFHPGSGRDEANDQISTAVETWQGRQHNPEFYATDAVIGDSTETLNDVSLDVDFYQFHMDIGDRVTIDVDGASKSTLDSVIRLFDATGKQVAVNDNGVAPGEKAGVDSYLSYIATAAGTYYLGVSGKGNETYDALSLGNRQGPASTGGYHMELNVLTPQTWVITAVDGTQITDGTTFTVSDVTRSVTYEFDDVTATPGVATGNVAIVYDSRPVAPQGFNHRGPGYRVPEMAVAMAEVIGERLTGVTAVALGGIAGATAALPQTPAIQGDTSVFGFPGLGHDNPYTPPETSGELYVVVYGATRITGGVDVQPLLNENIDQLLPETGILVSENASPTLMNNLLSNLNAGIWQDASPTTVVGGSMYQFNYVTDANIGGTNDDFNISVDDEARMFVDAADGNFYPAAGSPAIDSAIDALEERAQFAIVKSAMGIPVSPILAPNLDASGLLRSDDPEVDTPSGQGANVFKDRGGLDRADFVGPDAVLIVPRDNDQAGIDVDPTETVVQLAAGQYDNFTIQLVDGLQASESGEGTGVNDLTVNSSKVTITVDGRILEEGVDYIFRYNDTTNTIRLTPLAGVWDNTKAYKITLPNQDRFVITMPNGSEVTDGETFVLTDKVGGTVTFEYESGYSLFIPQTLRLRVPTVGNAPGGIQDGQRFVVSAGSLGNFTFEFDSNSPASILPGNIRVDISAAVTQDQVANAIVAALNGQNIGVVARNLGNGLVHFGAPGAYTVNTTLSALTQTGSTGVVDDGQTFQITNGANPPVVFEFDNNNSLPAGRVHIDFTLADTTDDLGARLAAIVAGSTAGLDPQYVQYLGDGHVLLGGTASHVLDITGSPRLTKSGTPGVQGSTVIVVPPQGTGSGGIADGQKFTIQQRPGAPVVFEFDRDGSVSPGSRPILFTLGSTVDQLAGYIISAIRLAGVGLNPQDLGGGQIALLDTIYHKTDTQSSKLTQHGVPGGVVAVKFIPDESFDSTQFAPLILDAIENSLLTDVTTTFRGGNTYFVNGIKSVSGLSNFFVAAIKDNAGNNLQPNQSTNQTHFTILMPGVELDYGDAPSQYGTTVADGGARHVITVNSLMLGTGVTSESDGTPSVGADSDTDDGVDVSLTILNEHYRAPVTVTASGRGFLNAWIDFNHDGDWSDPGEHALANVSVAAGINDLTIPTPTGASLGDAYARFRLSAESGVAADGIALDGEVEDYIVTVVPGTPPVADDDAYATTEDAILDIAAPGVLDGDTDIDGDPLSVLVNSPSLYGAAVTVYPDGRLVYDPTTSPALQALRPGETLVDSFTYRATDGVLPSNLATVRITVSGVADAPVAGDDDYATDEDTTLTVPAPGVLVNDFDADAADVISLVTFDAVSALGAAVSIDSQGQLTYNPTGSVVLQALQLGDTLVDTFSYTIRDLAGAMATATVSVSVSGINDAPVADNDAYATDEDTVLQVNAPGVFEGDVDVEGQTLLVDNYQSTTALGATVVLNGDGSFSYDPTSSAQLQALANGAIVNDTFTYTISDGSLVSNVATVTIQVTGVNDNPVANDDLYGTNEDSLLTVPATGVLANDTDVDTGDVLTVGSADSTSMLGAAVVVNADGSFTYDPRQVAVLQAMGVGQSLVDTFTYTVRDAFGAESTAVVSVRVTGLNDRPTVLDDYYIAEEDSVLTVDPAGVLDNDSDAEGQPLQVVTYDVVSQLGAQVTVLPDGSFTYDPTGSATLQGLKAGDIIVDTFTYRASDGLATSNPATVNILVNGINDSPLAVDDQYTTTEDDAFEVPTPGVLENDLDADTTDVLTVVYADGISAFGAAVTISSVGELFYNPVVSPALQALKPGQSVQDTFTYTIQDLAGVASTATVTVTVTGRNDGPVADADRYTIDEDSLLQVAAPGVLDGDTDIEGDSLQAEARVLTTTLGAQVTLLADGSFTYDPRNVAALQQLGPGESAEDTFTYRATDGTLLSTFATVTIEVTGVNDLPVARDDSSLVPRNGSITYPVLNNDTDMDGTLVPGSVVVVTAPAHGTAQVQANGSILYTPTADYRGPDSLTYRVSDNDGGVSNEATLTLLVNSPPVALDDIVETIRNVPVTINVLANDSDSDGTLVPGTVTIVTQPTSGTATVNANGTVRYVPATGYAGADFFTYTVRDDIGSTSNVARVDISVIANPFPWNNPLRSRDVNGDTFVTPIDALLIINDLNYRGSRKLPNPPQPPFVPPPFLDVNRDGFVTPVDALLVINYLNTGGEGEGESGAEGEGPSVNLAAAYGSTMFVDGSVAANRLVTPAQSVRRVAAPAAVGNVNDGLTIGREERMRYAALQDYLAEAAEEDLMSLVANDVSSAWGQDSAEHAALVDLLTDVVHRAKRRN